MASHLTPMGHWYWQARQRTGLGPSSELGGAGGSQRGSVASRAKHSTTRYMAFHETAERRLRQPFRGWPSKNANPWPGQSDHRNALSPAKQVSPRQRARSGQAPLRVQAARAIALRPGPQSIRHCAGQRERQSGYQTKQYSGLVAGRAVGPAGAGDAPGNGRAPS